MQKYQYIKVNSILAKFDRDFKGLNISELDAIEWVGEALGFMKIVNASEHAISFYEVKNYHCDIPFAMHYITQIARNNEWTNVDTSETCLFDTIGLLTDEECDCVNCECSQTSDTIMENCQGKLSADAEPVYYRPFFNLQYEYFDWVYSKARRNKYTPVTLAQHSFFDTLVCKEEGFEDIYNQQSRGDEYTIAGNQLRFSFESGFVAVAHTRTMIDEETGYPMIPDDESARAAISYYLGWKFKEQEAWNHREGALQLAQHAEERWLKYVKQFRNKAKMPTGTDEHNELMQQGRYLIPPQRRYYGFFGNLGKTEDRPFNKPYNRRNRSLR